MKIFDKILLKTNPVKIIERSDYFDAQWYRDRYGIESDPADHYLNTGWKENFNPSNLFSTKDYLINNPDIKDINPLLHYEVFGRYEGRKAFIPPIEKTGDYSADGVVFSCEDHFEDISKKELVSFDVFDTLVNRPFFKASDLFRYLEYEYDIPGFASARIKAEKDARERLNKEVDLDEIYDHIEERYKEYKNVEIENEIRMCHTNEAMKPLYDEARRLNKRIIAISDMYHSKDTIKKILNKSGYEPDEIYVSCEFNKTKGNGDLYLKVLEMENRNKKDMIHFGDNYLSDYSEARTLGIEAYQTPVSTDAFLSKESNGSFLSFLNKHDSLSSSVYLAMISERTEFDDFFEKLGYLFGGPLAMGYLKFVSDEAKNDGIDKLLFVSRDGYSLMEIYKKYFYERYHIDHDYAYLSRAAVFAGTAENHLNSDIRKLLEIFRFEIRDITIGKTDEEIKMEYVKHKDEIESLSMKRSNDLRKHLETLSDSYDKVAIVDMVSSRFTSFKGARYYLGERVKKGYFAGSFSSIEDNYSFYDKRLLGMRDNLPVKLSELLISSPESSVIGVDEDGKVIYEKEKDHEREKRYSGIIKGMYEYCDDHLKYFDIRKEYLPDFDEWIDLVACYLEECSDEDLNDLSDVIDSGNPVSSDEDKSFRKLIQEYRSKGY